MSHGTYHAPTTITQMSPPWGGEACGLLHRCAAAGGSPSHKALDKTQNQEIWNVLSSCKPGKSPRRTSLTQCWPRRVCPGKAPGNLELQHPAQQPRRVVRGRGALPPCLAFGRRHPRTEAPGHQHCRWAAGGLRGTHWSPS